ncbi:MAG: hypothetical protein HYV16_08400 [Gammaproteobacteria bacterium]|nr:hypothetical protein [Gammaproteobacteria bacterium]
MQSRTFATIALVAAAATAAQPPVPRPALEVHQGRYFRYAMPAGWRANETTNGVDMMAPDQVSGASFALLLGSFGQSAPVPFFQQVVSSIPDYQNPRFLSTKALPPIPAMMGLQWQMAEIELRYTYHGVPTRGRAVVGVMQGYGQYSAFVRSFQAPEKSWQQARYWLPAISETVIITNARQVAGQDRVRLPGPISSDYIYGDYNKAWEARGQADDRLSRDRSESTLGYERTYDEQTGRYYDMPYENYDASRGGYANPERPDELLERAPLGE